MRENVDVPDDQVGITTAEGGRRHWQGTAIERNGKPIKLLMFLPSVGIPQSITSTEAMETTAKAKGKT